MNLYLYSLNTDVQTSHFKKLLSSLHKEVFTTYIDLFYVIMFTWCTIKNILFYSRQQLNIIFDFSQQILKFTNHWKVLGTFE